MPVPENRDGTSLFVVLKPGWLTSLLCDCCNDLTSFAGIPMLNGLGSLSPVALSDPATLAPCVIAMGLMFGLALSNTFAHFAQKSTIRGGGGGASWVGAVIMDNLLRLTFLSRLSRIETEKKRATTARMMVIERAGRTNIVGTWQEEAGLP